MLRFLRAPLLLGLLAACQPAAKEPPATAPAGLRLVRDDFGDTMRVPAQPRRVLPLAPSMTEMLWAVADSGQIVGRTQNCDYPAAARRKPVVNTYPLDLEGLLRRKPDLVLTVEGMTSPGHIAQLRKLGIPVYQQRYARVLDIPRALEDLGRLVGRAAVGQRVADSLRRDLAALRVPPPEDQEAKRRPDGGVLAVTWTDPIYAYGYPTLFTDALRWLGVRNAVPSTNTQAFPVLPRETVLKLNPDVVIGGDFAALDTTLFRRYPELRQVRAYRERRVYAIDDNLLSRPSPRVGQLLRALRAVVRPEAAQPPNHPTTQR